MGIKEGRIKVQCISQPSRRVKSEERKREEIVSDLVYLPMIKGIKTIWEL